jgi:hypothetical protein
LKCRKGIGEKEGWREWLKCVKIGEKEKSFE